MTTVVLLEKVKKAIGITGTYQDETLQSYIDEVKAYLIDSGVSSNIVNSSTAVGIISRGVSDLWNYGAGNTTYSEYFIQRAIQLRYCDDNTSTSEPTEVIKYLCSIELSSPAIGENKSEISFINDTLYAIEINATFNILEDWHKDVCYKIGRIGNEKYYPVSDRILIGALFANNIEAAKQNFFRVCANGDIYVYSDLNILKDSVVTCTLSDTYM